MKLVMTLLVRDEEDILRENLEFHFSKGVDEVLLMDNLSTDATREIALEYERARCLHYMFQPDDNYAQGAWVTGMARRAYVELRADWVINSDADEFWFPHTGSVKDTLGALPERVNAVVAQRMNFAGRTPNGEPFWQRMTARHATPLNALGKPLPPKVAHRGRADVHVAQGNHEVRFDSEAVECAPVAIDILHFPVRSRTQYRNKIVKGGQAYARNNTLDPGVGNTWRQLYSLCEQGRFDQACDREILSDEEITQGLITGELVQDDRLINALSARRDYLG